MYAKLYQSYLDFADPVSTTDFRGYSSVGGSLPFHSSASVDSLTSLSPSLGAVLAVDIEAADTYAWNTLALEVQTAVEGHLLRATRMLNAETGGWQGGPFARPMAHNAALVPHFRALMHAVGELAVVLERRPILTGVYTRSAHRLFIEPLARPRAAVLAAAIDLGNTVTMALQLDSAFGVAAAVSWIRTHVLTSSASCAATVTQLERRLSCLHRARKVWRVGYTAALSAVHEEHARRAPRAAAATARAIAAAEGAAMSSLRLRQGGTASPATSPASVPSRSQKGAFPSLAQRTFGSTSSLDSLAARTPSSSRPGSRRLEGLAAEDGCRARRPFYAGSPCSRLSVDGRLGFGHPLSPSEKEVKRDEALALRTALCSVSVGGGGSCDDMRCAQVTCQCLSSMAAVTPPSLAGVAPHTERVSPPLEVGGNVSTHSLDNRSAQEIDSSTVDKGAVDHTGERRSGEGCGGIFHSRTCRSTHSGSDPMADTDGLADPVFLNSDDAVLFHAVTYTSSAVLDALVHLAETLLAELREREHLASAKT